jgi:hypothetical protein
MIEGFYATAEDNMLKASSAYSSAFSDEHNHPFSVFAKMPEIMRARKYPNLYCD